ncbi:flagellar hook-length control protein FliK [Aliiglaciecola sp.]|nr:flagellar hook-length control protein FliK [Aliiglaciecola sp.]
MQYIAIDKLKVADWPTKIGTQTNDVANQQVQFQSFLRDTTPKNSSDVRYNQPVEPKRDALPAASDPQTPSRKQSSNGSHVNREPEQGSNNIDFADSNTPGAFEQHQRPSAKAPADESPSHQSESSTLTDLSQSEAKEQVTKDLGHDDSQLHQSELQHAEDVSTQTPSNDAMSASDQAITSEENTALQDEITIEEKQVADDTDSVAIALTDADVSEIDWLTLVENGKNTELETQIVENGIAKIVGQDALIKDAESTIINSDNSSVAEQLTVQVSDVQPSIITEEQVKADLLAFSDLVQNIKVTSNQNMAQQHAILDELSQHLSTLDKGTLSAAELKAELQEISELYLSLTQALEGEGVDTSSLPLVSPVTIDASDIKNVDDSPLSASTMPTMAVDSQSTDENSDLSTVPGASQNQELNPEITLLQAMVSEETAVVEGVNSEETGQLAQPSLISSEEKVITHSPMSNVVEQANVPDTAIEPLMLDNAPADIKQLLELPAQKLDAVIDNIAQRLVSQVEKNSGNAQLSGIEKALSTTEINQVKTDFVNALKAGLEEIKGQLQQGHQPAIDLTALVAESMAKVTQTVIAPDAISQTISRFNQTLEVASLLNSRTEASQIVASLDKVNAKESYSQAQVLQNKQGQQLAQFDKAVNITRNEGLQQMAEKVRWMVNQQNLQAEIRLDPPDLGAMKVRINMAGDAASVSIVVQSQQARDVLEQATPRLKELLEQQGIELGQSSVQQESKETGQQHQGQFSNRSSGEQNTLQQEEQAVIEQPIYNGRVGGIDYFV